MGGQECPVEEALVTTVTLSDRQEAIRQAIALACGMPDYLGADEVTSIKTVEWQDRETAQGATPDLCARLRATAKHNLNRVETREELVEGATREDDYIARTVGGHVAVMLSVRITSRSQDPTKHAATRYAGLLTTRIWRDDVQALLSAANVSLSTVGPAVDTGGVWNVGRLESVALVELVLFTTEWDRDDNEGNGYVSEIQAEGTFNPDTDAEVVVTFTQDDQTPP